jgi:hypothetical protein
VSDWLIGAKAGISSFSAMFSATYVPGGMRVHGSLDGSHCSCDKMRVRDDSEPATWHGEIRNARA